MSVLQPRLHLKVAQKQVLTPSLVQMVNVLALNKLELRDMIRAEIVENPVLEELEESDVPLLDDVRTERDEAPVAEANAEKTEKTDAFDEIDFGSYFQDYLDPGFRAPTNFELTDRPSFENFLSNATTLWDYLAWQLGAITLRPEVRLAAEMICGNLNEDGYLTASDEELLAAFASEPALALENHAALLTEAMHIVRTLDPPGIAARDLAECLLTQLDVAHALAFHDASGNGQAAPSVLLDDTRAIVQEHLGQLQKRDLRDLCRAMRRPPEAVAEAVALIRTLDPKPGRRFHVEEARIVEPDVAIVKRGDEWVALMNEEDVPTLRLNQSYRRMLASTDTERDAKTYIKERYQSAIQLMRNIEQRKSTILRVCETIIRRQSAFLEDGVEALQPMMIKEVAEEIGVHPSTVSRAVSNKYVHTPQGVYELRFFFSESAAGPEGSGTTLMLLKRRVKRLIEEEDPSRPLTDDVIAQMLQDSGIQVTRRTVAKYREDLRIPSTHQRRVRRGGAQAARADA